MLTSIALIFIVGLLLSKVFQKLKLPGLLGMIITGIILSPYLLNLIDKSILDISADLRQIALVIILTRAGLSLDINSLKRVGRPAVLMCFLPACAEIAGTVLLAPRLLGVSVLDAAVIGSVIAAVSPAVIVPRMIKLIDEGWGKAHSVPQLILAGASVDDVFVIVVFTAFTSLAQTGTISPVSFLRIPVSIITGIAAGVAIGFLLVAFFKRFHMRDTVKVLAILSISFLMLEVQTRLENIVPLSALLSIMSMGIVIKMRYEVLAQRLSAKYNKLWVGAEIMLFVLVGATVDLKYAMALGAAAIVLVVCALAFRMAGVFCCLLKTELDKKERLFCMLAYTPKATVQAALGAVPLAMGLSCGQAVLTVAVLSILITAPFGAMCVDKSYNKLLKK